MEKRLLRAILEYFSVELILEDGKIKNVAKNLLTARNIGIVQSDYVEKISTKVVGSIASIITKINRLNRSYFSSFFGNRKKVNTVSDRIMSRTLQEIGFKDGKVIKNGFLADLANSQSVFDRIKGEALKSIASGSSLGQFRGRMGEFLTGKGETNGEVSKYWQRMTFDIYQQQDRKTQLNMANDLGLQFAIYGGGLIVTSRDFCEVRNAKVFHKSEIEMFGTSADKYGGYSNKSAGEFQGKPPAYNPLTDEGGYNCRHSYSWVSDETAIQMRPDAKNFIHN